MAKREQYLWVCQNERAHDNPKGCCLHKGSREIKDALKVGIIKRGLHKRFRVMESSCQDLCWIGPSIAVMPDHVFYGNVELGDVDEILDALEAGTLVERLVVSNDMYDDPQMPTKKGR